MRCLGLYLCFLACADFWADDSGPATRFKVYPVAAPIWVRQYLTLTEPSGTGIGFRGLVGENW